MSIRYITIREFSSFHDIDVRIVQELVDFGLVETLRREEEWCIRGEDVEPLEMMVRLRRDLGVNPAGIETILHMRRRLETLRRRVEELERDLRRYERLLDKMENTT